MNVKHTSFFVSGDMVAHNCHGKTKNLTAKTKYLTAKPKTSRQKQNTSRQNRKPHGKTKNLTAKPNTSQQKQNSFGLAVGICFCRGVFGFCCEVFGFVVRYFDFAARFFSFAVRFLVLPWQLWATVGWNKRCKYLYLYPALPTKQARWMSNISRSIIFDETKQARQMVIRMLRFCQSMINFEPKIQHFGRID